MIELELWKMITLFIFSTLCGFAIGAFAAIRVIVNKCKSKKKNDNDRKNTNIEITFDDITVSL